MADAERYLQSRSVQDKPVFSREMSEPTYPSRLATPEPAQTVHRRRNASAIARHDGTPQNLRRYKGPPR